MLKVPWVDREILETEAKIVLSDYSQKIRKITEPPVPVENIIEAYFGLRLEIDDLNGGNFKRDVLGCLYVEDEKVVVDRELENQEGRYNFTCAHEVGHWVLHRDLYLQNKTQIPLFENIKEPSIICRESQHEENIEWQADYFGGALLMPKEMLVEVLRDGDGELRTHNYHRNDVKLWGLEKESYCQGIASLYNKRFGVSVQAMKVRLEQSGLLREEVNTRLL